MPLRVFEMCCSQCNYSCVEFDVVLPGVIMIRSWYHREAGAILRHMYNNVLNNTDYQIPKGSNTQNYVQKCMFSACFLQMSLGRIFSSNVLRFAAADTTTVLTSHAVMQVPLCFFV